jgi:hypothetical protein
LQNKGGKRFSRLGLVPESHASSYCTY